MNDHAFNGRDEQEALARRLASHGYRILRPLPLPSDIWLTTMPPPDCPVTLAVVDTETTGVEAEAHELIEIAIVMMTIDRVSGELVDIRPPHVSLEQPSAPLAPEISALTGLTDADLAGQQFDERVSTLLDQADFVVAWNAPFDLGFVMRRWPALMPRWGCAMTEIDWRGEGLEGRALGHVLTSAGYWMQGAHRAGVDAWATAVLLSMIASDGRTYAAHLVGAADRQTALVSAHEAPFALRQSLKGMGYRWNAERRVWQREVELHAANSEIVMLKSLHPLIKPRTEVMDATIRHMRR